MIKRFVFTIVFFVLALTVVSAQTISDSIVTKQSLGSVYFKYHGKTLTVKRFSEKMKILPEASKEYNIAKNNLRIATIFALIGGGLLGACVNNGINTNTRAVMFGSGLAMSGGLVLFQRKYNKRAKKAVAIYNSSLQ